MKHSTTNVLVGLGATLLIVPTVLISSPAAGWMPKIGWPAWCAQHAHSRNANCPGRLPPVTTTTTSTSTTTTSTTTTVPPTSTTTSTVPPTTTAPPVTTTTVPPATTTTTAVPPTTTTTTSPTFVGCVVVWPTSPGVIRYLGTCDGVWPWLARYAPGAEAQIYPYSGPLCDPNTVTCHR